MRPVEDLQAGGWSGAIRMGAVGGTACPAYAFSLLSVVFVVALICFVSAFVFGYNCYLLCICFEDRLV